MRQKELRHSYEPRNGSGLRHDPTAAILGPRPIGWISTCDAVGRLNLAPYSFFNVFNYQPPIVAFSSVGYKDTIKNVQDTGEFVYNLATRALADAVNTTSAEVSGDEFHLSGLTPLPSVLVRPYAVAQSPVAMECKAIEVKQLRDHAGAALDTWMVLGEIVMVHIDQALLDRSGGGYDTAAARPILRGGGPANYFEITPEARFLMRRPIPETA